MKERKKVAEMFIGKLGMDLRLFGGDSRSAMTNAAIITAIALEGPAWPFEIHTRAARIAKDAKLPLVNVPSEESTFYRRIQDLHKRQYLKAEERKGLHTGPKNSKVYDLTVKGSVVALTISYVQNKMSDFLRWRDSEENLRLDGLKFINLMIDRGITKKLWGHFLSQALRKTLILDFEIASHDEVRELLYASLLQAMLKTWPQDGDRRDSVKKVTDNMKRLDVTDKEWKQFYQFYTTDPEVEQMLIDFKYAIHELHEGLPGMEMALDKAVEALREQRKVLREQPTSISLR